MADAIKVAIRVRPMTSYEDEQQVNCVNVISSLNQIQITNGQSTEAFTFDYVADQGIKQHALYSIVAEEIINGCLDGYNGTIFAYGQTGSGKTYTMMGPAPEGGERGLMPRAFEHLYMAIRRREDQCSNGKLEYLCKASFLEIYNENIVDLLDPKKGDTYNLNHHIREDLKRGVYIEHLTEVACDSAAACIQILQQGIQNRHQAETQMNHESSRSHAVFCLEVESKHTSPENLVNFRRARLNLVDLAGSERQKSTGAAGKQFKEGCHINKSLSALGSVINALVERSQGRVRHVPFRDSKLTFLLKDSLGGNSRTTVIATIHPNSFGESLSTLKFAQRAKRVKNQPIVNEDMTNDIQALKAEICRLRLEVECKSAEGPSSSSHTVTPPFNIRHTIAACNADHLPHTEAVELVAEWLQCQLHDAQAALEHETAKRERLESRVEAQAEQLQCLHMCCQWMKDGAPPNSMMHQVVQEVERCFCDHTNPFVVDLLCRCQALETEVAALKQPVLYQQLRDAKSELSLQQAANVALHVLKGELEEKVSQLTLLAQEWESKATSQGAALVEANYERQSSTTQREGHLATIADLQHQLHEAASNAKRLQATIQLHEKEYSLLQSKAEAAQVLYEQGMTHAKEEKLYIVQKLEEQLNVQEDLIATLKADKSQCEEHLRTEMARCHAFQEQCVAKQQQLLDVQGKLDIAYVHCQQLEDSLDLAQTSITKLQLNLEDAESSAKSDAAAYQCRIDSLDGELSKLRCEVMALESTQGTQDLEYEHLSEQLNRKKHEAETEIRKRDRQVAVLQNQCKRLSLQLPTGRSQSMLSNSSRHSCPFAMPLPQRSVSALEGHHHQGLAARPASFTSALGRPSLCSEAPSSPNVVEISQSSMPDHNGLLLHNAAPPSPVSRVLSFSDGVNSIHDPQPPEQCSTNQEVASGCSKLERSEPGCDDIQGNAVADDDNEAYDDICCSPVNGVLCGRHVQDASLQEMGTAIASLAQENNDLKSQLTDCRESIKSEETKWEQRQQQHVQQVRMLNDLVDEMKRQLAAEFEKSKSKCTQVAKLEQQIAVLQESNSKLKETMSSLTKCKNQNTRIHLFEKSMQENVKLKEEQLTLKEQIKSLQREKDECLSKLQQSQEVKENVLRNISPNVMSAVPGAKRRRILT